MFCIAAKIKDESHRGYGFRRDYETGAVVFTKITQSAFVLVPCSKMAIAFSFGAGVSFATITATIRLPKNPGTISNTPVETVRPVNSQFRSITNPEMTPATAP